jgi:hypothetical protein
MVPSGDFRCKRIKIPGPRGHQTPRRKRTAGSSTSEGSTRITGRRRFTKEIFDFRLVRQNPEEEKNHRFFDFREVLTYDFPG